MDTALLILVSGVLLTLSFVLGLRVGYGRGLDTAREILRECSLDRQLLKHIERF